METFPQRPVRDVVGRLMCQYVDGFLPMLDKFVSSNILALRYSYVC